MKKRHIGLILPCLEVTSEVKRIIEGQIRIQRPKIVLKIHISNLDDEKDKLTWHDLALEVTSEVKCRSDGQIRTQRPKIVLEIHISHSNEAKSQFDLTWPCPGGHVWGQTYIWRPDSNSATQNCPKNLYKLSKRWKKTNWRDMTLPLRSRLKSNVKLTARFELSDPKLP